jgi:hypothetical protein
MYSSEQHSSARQLEKPLSQSANTSSWPVGDDSHGLLPDMYASISADDHLDSSSWLANDTEYVLGLSLEGGASSLLETPPSSEESDITSEAPNIYTDTPLFIQHCPSRLGDLVNSIDGNGLDCFGDTWNLDPQARGYRFDSPMKNNHANIWLARLNGDIARHVAEINTYPVQPKQLQRTCYDDIQVATTNPLSHVLNCTSSFLYFVQALGESSSSVSQPSGQQYSMPTFGSGIFPSQQPSTSELSTRASPIDIPTILMLLSGHLQLIQLYDAIFLRAYITLQAVPYDQIAAYQALPGMQLSGCPIVPGHLQIKIIFQMIGHYLQKIERFIGLPPEYSIYGRQESCQGILSNLESPVLVRAVMEQVNYDRRGAGIYHITSLKDNIRKVQEILETC